MNHQITLPRNDRLWQVAGVTLLALALLASLLLAFGVQAAGQEAEPASGPALLVGLKAEVVPARAPRLEATSFAAEGIARIMPLFSGARGTVQAGIVPDAVALAHIYRAEVAPGTAPETAMARLRARPEVAYVEPDYLAHELAVPNDPLYPQQWGLAQIDAPAAWDVTEGAGSVVIAVIDAGLDTDHPDLLGRLWQNLGEIPHNGMDDDNNGRVDDVNGWNLLDDNDDLGDNTGHGTQVAGIIGAGTGNGEGIAGVCGQCRLMVLKVVQPGGAANYSDIAQALYYAAEKQAEVINLSLGGYSDSATLRAAVAAAAESAVIVAGAGNDDSSAPLYPAAFEEVLAVTGTDPGDVKGASANYGSWVDLSAPGVAISTTFSGGGYGTTSGTSLAAPFAAGVAGLVRSAHPTWEPATVRAQLRQTAVEIDGLNGAYAGQLGSGRLAAGAALNTAAIPDLSVVQVSVDGTVGGRPEPGSTVELVVTVHNGWAPATGVTALLGSNDPYVTVEAGSAAYGDLLTGAEVANGTPFRVTIAAGAPFGHALAFNLALAAGGSQVATLPFTVTTAATEVSVGGIIDSDTVWTNDRVYIASNVRVSEGVTLTIEAGTMIKVQPDRALMVEGTLIADGTAEMPIVFTSAAENPMPGDWGTWFENSWGGIFFQSTSPPAQFDTAGNYLSGSIIRHAVVEYGKGIVLREAEPYIAHNLIQRTGGEAAIYLFGGFPYYGMPVVRSNRIVDNETRALNVWLAGARIEGNLIANNQHGINIRESRSVVISNTIMGNGGAYCEIELTPAICLGPRDRETVVRNNNILANESDYAIALYDTTETVDVSENYWGTVDQAEIRALLYDAEDGLSLGPLVFEPFLVAPEPTAPAFLDTVETTPGSPIGLETAAIDLHFSGPMDGRFRPDVRYEMEVRYNSDVIPGLVNDQMHDLAVDGDGSVWFATEGGVLHYDGGNWTVYEDPLFKDGVHTAAVDNEGYKWFGTPYGLIRFNGVDWTVVSEMLSGPDDIAVAPDGGLWMARCQEAIYFDGSEATGYSIEAIMGSSDCLNRVIVDAEGSVWFQGFRLVYRFDGESWQRYAPEQEDPSELFLYGLAVTGEDNIWVCDDKALYHYDGTEWTPYTSPLVPVPASPREMFVTDEGNLWVGGSQGWAYFDGEAWSAGRFESTALHYGVARIGMDARGSVWFATDDGAVQRYLYPVPDAAGSWIDDAVYRVTQEVTALMPRGTYRVAVQGAVDGAGMPMLPAMVPGFSVDYAGEVSDYTPPPAPSVLASGVEGDVTAVTARWDTTDPDSPIQAYRYALGSSAGSSDIVNWTVTEARSITLTGFGFTAGEEYWLSVQAQNSGGLWSEVTSRSFVAGEGSPQVMLPVVIR